MYSDVNASVQRIPNRRQCSPKSAFCKDSGEGGQSGVQEGGRERLRIRDGGTEGGGWQQQWAGGLQLERAGRGNGRAVQRYLLLSERVWINHTHCVGDPQPLFPNPEVHCLPILLLVCSLLQSLEFIRTVWLLAASPGRGLSTCCTCTCLRFL